MSSRLVRTEDIVGASTIAERLGLSAPQVVSNWQRRHRDFPRPIAKVGKAYVWAWPDIVWWTRRTGRLPVAPSRMPVAIRSVDPS